MSCDEIRLRLHEAYDEQPPARFAGDVRLHLAGCGACREFEADLAALGRAIQELPRSPLPDEVLESVWSKTSRGRATPSWSLMGHWRLAAAVLVTAVSMGTLYYVFAPPPPPSPSAVELAQAKAGAELVIGYTARALAAARHAAADRVLASKVSPAVRGQAAQDSRRPR